MTFYEWFFLEKDRPAAGLFSWSHLLSVTICLAIAIGLGIFLGKKYKDNEKIIRRIFIIITFSILALYIMKMGFLIAISPDVGNTFLENIPLFFCDVMIFIVPLIAFCKGRVQEVCFDSVAICGFLMGLMGNYFAGNIYASHPAFSYLSLISAVSHSISAFVAMLVFIAKLNKMEKKNIPFVIGILVVLMSVALTVDTFTGKNYMFLLYGDDTPFGLLYDMVNGNLPAYQFMIYLLQCGYIGVFYLVYYLIIHLIRRKKEQRC